MIRAIAAIDNKRGLATDKGIPWNLPTDRKYYHDKITGHLTLVGRGTYHEAPDRRNIVAARGPIELFNDDIQVTDARAFLQNTNEDIWVIGGAQIFTATLDVTDELYLTLIEGDFHCTKFFPKYQDLFECVDKGTPQTENGITFRFTVWKRKA